MILQHDDLKQYTHKIFAAAGCSEEEAARVAEHLVEANLVGHDSHGVIRIARYIEWIQEGKVLANQQVKVILENDMLAVLDGQFGLGQSIGEQAVRIGLDKCSTQGISIVGLRDAGHLGRIGDWPLMAAKENKISIHFVNTSGAGILVAPFGGVDRRLSANPFAVGVPRKNQEPIILDISACMMAEGKIRVALHQGKLLPDGCIIDAQGQPANDPKAFYDDPPGSILSIAGHKGYGLALVTEMLAGALTGGGCSNVKNKDRLANGMLSIYIDPEKFAEDQPYHDEINRYVDYVKSSQTITPDGTIYMPGEIEAATRADRATNGIDVADTTWQQIYDTAQSLGVSEGLPQPADS
jgi:uncharacterized oxidoreductase